MKHFRAKPTAPLRFLLPACLFTVLCAVFLCVLALVQIEGSKNPTPADDGTFTRTVTVAGIRGEIYDREGRLLVGNETSYDLIFEYGAMADTRHEVNRALLDILDALRKTGNEVKLSDDYFVLEGTYPHMHFVDELKDRLSPEYYHYERVLAPHGMTPKETSVKDLLDYFTDRYKLSTSRYTDREITDLLRLLYEMERVGFGAYQSYTVAKGVNMKMVTAVQEARIEGAVLTTGTARVYRYPGIASHILGRVGKITAENADYYNELGYPMDAYVGTEGVEKQFEHVLRGQDGVMVIRYDRDGNIIEKYYEVEPIGGNDVYLTIDIDLQIAAEKALAENVSSIASAKGGAATVLDPNDGSVLALASYPTYDWTQFGDSDYVSSILNSSLSPMLNRAISGLYAPGSTYKMGVALAALQNGKIDSDTCFTCHGIYAAYNTTWGCTHTDGTINVSTAIQNSCNVFFYNVLDHVLTDISEVTAYTSRLGLGVPTGIELPEATGTVAGPANSAANNLLWTKGNDISAAIGQSDHAYTPLQLAVYTASLANGGTRYSAHLLDSVHTFSDELVEQYEVAVLDQVEIDPDVHSLLIEAMGDVVSENPEVASRFANVPVAVGGKTGTAQYDGRTDYALFTGFAPLYDPEIVAVCVIEEGRYGYRAGETVSAVFQSYFEKQAENENKEVS